MQQLAGLEVQPVMESDQVGRTILQQMGGTGRLAAMLGAKNIMVSSDSASFKWPNKERAKGNAVIVTLDDDDTYTMEFFNGMKSVKTFEGLHNNQLVSTFESHTGWSLNLGSGAKRAEAVEVELAELSLPSDSPMNWTMYTRGKGDRKPTKVGQFPPDKTEAEIVKAYERGQGHKLKKVGEGQYEVITKSRTVGAMIFLVPPTKKAEAAEDCGCDEPLDEGRSGMEAAIWKAFPTDSRSTSGAKRVMLTGSVAKAAQVADYTTVKLSDLTDHQLKSVLAVIQKKEHVDGGLVAEMHALLGEAPKKTYAAAQADIIGGLAKDGWKVQKTAPTGKPLSVPYATSPDGKNRLYFKSQAIYLSHDNNPAGGKSQHDMKTARSLHLADIRDGDYESFGKQLSKWTGSTPSGKKPEAGPDIDALVKKATELGKAAGEKGASAAPAMHPAVADLMKGFKVGTGADKIMKAFTTAHTKATLAAPVPDDKTPSMSPDQYRAKHGSCPDGYNFNASTKRCEKVKSEAKREPCPECKASGAVDEEGGCGCETKAPKKEHVSEMMRLAGVNRYSDHVVSTEKRVENAREREYLGLDGAHSDWKLQ